MLFLFKHACHVCPLRDKVVFVSFDGKGFGENPGCIAQEIMRQKLPWELVWLVTDMQSFVPDGIRKVYMRSFKAVWELSTAKIIINNVKNGMPYIKRPRQYYIQTWHGTFPLKYIEKECEELLDQGYVVASKRDSADIDLILSGCKLDSEIYRNSFWYNGEIFEHGVPRHDVLFRNNADISSLVKHELGINENARIVLYAPTFRDDGSLDAYNLDAEGVVSALNEKTKDEWVIVIRLHPNVTDKASLFTYSDKIKNGSYISDPQQLVVASDILISDYSSIIVDFSLMKKPVFLFVPDLDDYVRMRGLRDVYFGLPFSRCHSNNELLNSIKSFSISDYSSKIEEYLRYTMRCFDDGHASEKVVERMKEVIKREEND